MAKLKKALSKASTKGKTEKKGKKPVEKAAEKKAEKNVSHAKGKLSGVSSDDPAVAKPSKKKASSKKKDKSPVAEADVPDDDLPPVEADDELIGSTIDVDEIAREVERTEGKAYNIDEMEDTSIVEPTGVVAEAVEAEAAADEESGNVLPAMEGMSILRKTELNDVIQDVKRRSETNGGYITYEELNQILPQNIVDAIQSDKYLQILETLGVQVIREDIRWVRCSFSLVMKRLKSAPQLKRPRRRLKMYSTAFSLRPRCMRGFSISLRGRRKGLIGLSPTSSMTIAMGIWNLFPICASSFAKQKRR